MDRARKSNFKHNHVHSRCNNLFRARFVIMRLRPTEAFTLYINVGFRLLRSSSVGSSWTVERARFETYNEATKEFFFVAVRKSFQRLLRLLNALPVN